MTMRRSIAVVLMLLGSLAVGLAGIAQQSVTEAPAGFDTPTLAQNPGSRSISNGIEEPPGDTFALDQQIYEQSHDVNSGLGPVFNARACAECHQNPVSGGASQFTELRAGHCGGSFSLGDECPRRRSGTMPRRAFGKLSTFRPDRWTSRW